MKKVAIEAFHATDMVNAMQIIENGFTYKPNKSHWLGNGVYFYLDYSLAEWWSTNPSKSFGARIKIPTIIKCQLFSNTDRILDLRKLADYHNFVKIYIDDFMPKVFNGTIDLDIPNVNDLGSNNRDNLNFNSETLKILRCAYCDFLSAQYEVDLIIGTFNLPNQPYLPKNYGIGFELFSLNYIETQICVFNQDIIYNIAIFNEGGKLC